MKRPKKLEKKTLTAYRLEESIRDKAREIGHGNESEGIRIAVRAYQTKKGK